MADIRLRSTDGASGDDGSTWSLAKDTFANAATAAGANGRVFASQVHSQSVAGSALTLTLPGAPGHSFQLIGVNDAADPPTTLTAGAQFTTTGTASAAVLSVAGSGLLSHILLDAQSTGSAASLFLNSVAGDHQRYQSCQLYHTGSGVSANIRHGNAATSAAQLTETLDCEYLLGNAAQNLEFAGDVQIHNLTFSGSTVSPTSVFRSATTGETALLTVVGGSIANLSSGVNLAVGGSTGAAGRVVINNLLLPSGWTGGAVSAAITVPGYRVEAYACHSADGTYVTRAHDNCGALREETTYVRTGGFSPVDGNGDAVPMAWKIDTQSSHAVWPVARFRSLVMPIYVAPEEVGSPMTITVPILFDDAAERQDDAIELVVGYMNTDGSVRMVFASSAPGLLASAQDLDSLFGASSGWSTSGMSNPKQRQLQVTITPEEVGPMLAWLNVYQQAVFYVDPKPIKS